ncbi:MAG: hypothetical protein K1000chlam3_01720 [Chlamydiae bacterium]|nr:hypothetical protein [Chlamydiota bacterium]
MTSNIGTVSNVGTVEGYSYDLNDSEEREFYEEHLKEFNSNEKFRFKNTLKKLFDNKNLPSKLDYQEPYKGKLGSHPAEIYHPADSSCIARILEKMHSFGLTSKGCNDDTREADVLTAGQGYNGGESQLIITNDRALGIFKKAVPKEYEETRKKREFKPFDYLEEMQYWDSFERNLPPSMRDPSMRDASIHTYQLTQALPKLQNLIVHSRNGMGNKTVELIAENQASLNESEKIIRNALEKPPKIVFKGLISQRISRDERKVLEVSYKALEALERLCLNTKKEIS